MSDPAPGPSSDLSLADLEERIASQRLPPVAQWYPEREADMDMLIRRDGSWWYQGSMIQRKRMVRLFSTILRREADGRFSLVTPVEKLFITVEDAPFTVIAMTVFNANRPGSTLAFETNVGDHVVLDQQHPIIIEEDTRSHPKPYLAIRAGLRALLTRSVYYQLVEQCVEREGEFGVMSCNTFHVLGPAPVDEPDVDAP